MKQPIDVDPAPFADLACLGARLLVAALFAAGTVQKIVDPAAAQALLTARGWPEALIWPALVFNAGVALALIAGIAVRGAALLAAGYCALTSLFHYIPSDPWQMSIFVKNWAIAGGCLALYVSGPGRFRLGSGKAAVGRRDGFV